MKSLQAKYQRVLVLLLIGLLLSGAYTDYQPAQAQATDCGKWSLGQPVERIGAGLVDDGSGESCLGIASFNNQTSVVKIANASLGGYTFEMTTQANNANFDWVSPWGVEGQFLLPSLDIELNAKPLSPASPASIAIQGDITTKSFLLDASIFLLKSGLEFLPLGSCLIPGEAIIYAATRTLGIADNAITLAVKGDFLAARKDLIQVLPMFYARAQDALVETGVNCALDLIPGAGDIAKVGISFLTWFPKVAFDYAKYFDQPVTLTLTYTPVFVRPPTPTLVRAIRWERFPSPTANNLYGLTIVSPTNGWAVGDGGTILHWDGTSWQLVSSPTANLLACVTMTPGEAERDGWIGGDLGTLLHWDGSSWLIFDSGWGENHIFNSCSTAGNVLWFAAPRGGKLGAWDGVNFLDIQYDTASSAYNQPGFYVNNVRMQADNLGWAVGSFGLIMRWDGTKWSLLPGAEPESELYSIVMIPGEQEGWIVGAGGLLLRWNGSAWSMEPALTDNSIFDISFSTSADGWAVGENGVTLYWDGGRWSERRSPVTSNLNAVFMLSPEDGWAVGDNGVILHYQEIP